MVFSSTVFIFLFLPIVLGIYYFPLFKNNRRFKNIFLLLASLIFYAWGEPIFIFLMMISIFITWAFGLFIDKSENHRKTWLVVGVVYHVGILFAFKYLSFLAGEIGKLIEKDMSAIDISLPIGISFFTFQMMSYLFDIYYKNAEVQKNLLYVGLYVSLFPQLIAGPIVRYETIADEIENRTETGENFIYGIRRFVIGLGKKALVADYLAIISDNVFDLVNRGNVGFVTAWIGAIAYMLEIYFDFSGYSDMAIGLGRCFGFHFKENFNYPYLANSINDFWKRWHISLTDWFRDYVYIPMGGNRCSVGRNVCNIALVWILTGIWHGANWTFLLWGIIYCILQILEKYVYQPKKWPLILQKIYTLLIVCGCWVIFRADSVTAAGNYIANMLGIYGFLGTESMNYLKNSAVILMIGVLGTTPWTSYVAGKMKTPMAKCIGEIVCYLALGVVLILAAVLSISGGYSPFIYFNF
jgi:D-alanyl-lipoteichoic acid acyltransferase DltB (MBOAT superfamily)